MTDILSKGDTQSDFSLLHWTVNCARKEEGRGVLIRVLRETEPTGYAKIQMTRFLLGWAHRTVKSGKSHDVLSSSSRSTKASGGIWFQSRGLRIRGAVGVIAHTGVKP